jgi:hypothetical protein
MPLPGLLSAQVVKQYRRRRVVRVKHRVIFGPREALEQVLVTCGWQINTAFVDRLNLDMRQRVAAVGRRAKTLCQGEDGVQHQLAVFQSYHNVVLPHTSLRQPMLIPEPHQRQGLSQGVAAVHTRDGSGIDRPRVVASRHPLLSGATVAPTARALRVARHK